MEVVAARPDLVFLSNLANGTTVEAQFNPSELEETLGAEYAKQKVVGLSHAVKQFIATMDYAASFTLKFDSTPGTEAHAANLEARKLLMAWCYPRGDANVIGRAGAPRLLFFWPGLISMTCVLTNLKFKHTRFNLLMQPVQFEVAIQLEEIRDKLLLMDVAEDVGTER